MTKKERISAALDHREPDRVPAGEISIEAGFANRLLGTSFPGDYQHYARDRMVRERLEIDYVNMGDWPSYDLGISEQGYRVYRSAYGDQYAVTAIPATWCVPSFPPWMKPEATGPRIPGRSPESWSAPSQRTGTCSSSVRSAAP